MTNTLIIRLTIISTTTVPYSKPSKPLTPPSSNDKRVLTGLSQHVILAPEAGLEVLVVEGNQHRFTMDCSRTKHILLDLDDKFRIRIDAFGQAWSQRRGIYVDTLNHDACSAH